MKRGFDIFLGCLAGLSLFVPVLMLSIAVSLTSKGPILYWSERVGRNNIIFKMPKFRSMRVGTPAVATHLLVDGRAHLTPIGSFLRKSSLDELPQLWSILVGDMSFVGPRPALFNQQDLISLRTEQGVHTLTPGLTGWAQINGRDELSIIEKVNLDVAYLQKRSFWFDLRILWMAFSDVQQLEIDDLLGREQVKPDHLLINLNNYKKTVLVTGAGGSIGSELCRQILKARPRRLLMVEMSEFALYQIHQEIEFALELSEFFLTESLEVIPLLASVCDEVRMNEIMNTWKPHTVYHAAAYKHVPLVEHNPAEGVRNNVWGTKVCAEVAVRNGVQNFVLISTDKAVRPTNIMGATKRIAEMVLQALNETMPSYRSGSNNLEVTRRTCFSIVRFGNVLGSSGSVVPLFREQIKNGGPITLTHPDVTRYFMTIPEAAQLVIQAGAMGAGGDVFVLDMGEPVRIFDLASRIIQLSGLTLRDKDNPQGDIEIKITGLRPGEKLYEELLIGENPVPTKHPRILKAQEKFVLWDQLLRQLGSLTTALSMNDVPAIRNSLKQIVNGYKPSGNLVDWIYLARERL